MTDDEIELEIDRQLAAEEAARRAALRNEIAARMRAEAYKAHYDRINAKHPIEDKYAGLTPAQHAERLRVMDAAARATCEKMDRANERTPWRAERGPRGSIDPGGEGLKIR
jgi:hypothetical protein